MAGRLAAHIGVLLLCNVCVSGTWTLDPRPPATLQNDADGSEAVPRGAVSLAFVLDVTGSMHDDLVQVADGLKGILDVTLSRKDALFYSYVLVPFHDPVVGPAFVTRDPEEFQQRLENLTVSGGGDCPEMALTAVREALRLSLPSSYVYVFTDASSKDFHLLDQVLDLVQTKGSQVVFVTTGDCGDTRQPGYRAFERIAATSSGQVFHLNKSDVNEVLDFVKLSIRPRHVNLVSIDASPSTEQVLELNIDSTIVEFTVSMAGHNPRLAVVDPQGRVLEHGAELSVVLDLKNALIIRVQQPMAGRWLLRASGNGSHSIRATGVSEAQFTHGFSREPTDTLSETRRRPLEGVPTYLLVNGTKRAVFTELRLLSLRGETLAEGVPLHPVPNRPTLFNSSSFVPPDDFFYLEVIGTDPEGFPLSRIAQTAIKAQPPAAPEVETESVLEVHVGGNASLGCHVGTQVPFVAHWLKDGLPVTGPQKFRQSAEYPLHLIRVSAKDAGLYVCRASNEVGVTNAATSVRIRDSIPVQNSSFVSGGRAVLPCKPPGTKMATPNGVTWYRLRSGAVEQAWEVVPQDGRLHKGLNGSLVLEDVDAVDEGTYECVPADGTTRFRHQLVVLVAPKVQLNPDTVTFGPGDHFEVTCTASGAPAPRVWWAVPAELRSRIEPKGQRLVVHSARAGDELEEVYCVAANQAGRDTGRISLKYVAPPTMDMIQRSYEPLQGSQVSLMCPVHAEPPSKVTWYKDGHRIDPGSEHRIVFREDRLYIQAVHTRDTGIYKCTATSAVGESSAEFNLNVLAPPTYKNEVTDATLRVVENVSLSFDCAVFGNPEPEITWFKDNRAVLKTNKLDAFVSSEEQTLKIASTRMLHDGVYTCIANNKVGRVERSFRLEILLPPEIHGSVDEKVRAVEGQDVSLECQASGVPIPDLAFFRKGRLVESLGLGGGRRELRIPAVKTSDAGSYVCRASNEADITEKKFHLDVRVPPSIVDQTSVSVVKVRNGGAAFLECPVKGTPSPEVSWVRNGLALSASDPRLQIRPLGLVITKTWASDAGKYACTAVNDVGSATKDFVVNVLAPPEFEDGGSDISSGAIREVLLNSPITLRCPVDGNPTPEVTWFKDDIELTPRGDRNIDITHHGQRLNVPHATEENTGLYTCKANNELGEILRHYNLQVRVPPYTAPGISDYQTLTPLEGGSLSLSCNISGNPVPAMTWLKDGLPLTPFEFPNIQFLDSGRLLNISSVEVTHSGKYMCIATSKVGSADMTFLVDVQAPAFIDGSLQDRHQTTMLHQPVTFGCPATGSPPPGIAWFHDGVPVLPSHQGVLMFQEGRLLTLQAVLPSSAGIYTCEASNVIGHASLDYILEVLVPPIIRRKNLTSEFWVVEGSTVLLQCPADGRPPPTIVWLRGAEVLSPESDSRVTISEEDHSLTLKGVRLGDRKFTCLAGNEAGTAEQDYRVHVMVLPRLEPSVSLARLVSAVVNRQTTLRCPVVGVPPPALHWLKEGRLLRPKGDPFVQTSADGRRLLLRRVRLRDGGNYTCVAVNEAGKLEQSYVVDVQVPPRILRGPTPTDHPTMSTDTEERVQVIVNGSLSLPCVVTAQPEATLVWMRDSVPLRMSDSRLEFVPNEEALHIRNVKVSDKGKYTCIASNDAGTAEKDFHVTVLVPPRIAGPNIVKIEVVENRAFAMECHVESLPRAAVYWTRNGLPYESDNLAEGAATPHGSRRLWFPSVRASDRGNYICVAENEAGLAEKTFQVEVNVPPSIHVPEKAISVSESTPTKLRCQVSGIPTPSIFWMHEDDMLYDNNTKDIGFAENGQIVQIPNAKLEHSGRYTCVATNAAGSAEEQVTLSVLVPPRISKGPSPPPVMLQHPATLECQVEAHPTARIEWTKDGELLESQPLVRALDGGRVLQLVRVTEELEGAYMCRAANAAGVDDHTLFLSVLVPPRWINPKSREKRVLRVTQGSDIQMECFVSGRPHPRLVWQKDGKEISRLPGHISLLQDQQTLYITHAEIEDAGRYTCSAINSAGNLSQHFELHILNPPKIVGLNDTTAEELAVPLGETLTLPCNSTGDPPPLVSWIRDGTRLSSTDPFVRFSGDNPSSHLVLKRVRLEDAGRYICVVTNSAGVAEKHFTVTVTVPASIVKPKVVAEVNVVSGERATLECSVRGLPKPTVLWFKDGLPIFGTERQNARYTFLLGGETLLVQSSGASDSGSYKCEASNPDGSDELVYKLRVVEPPDFGSRLGVTEVSMVRQGDATVIECPFLADERFPTSTRWQWNGKSLAEDLLPSNLALSLNARAIHVVRAQRDNAGRYTCTASNVAGEAHFTTLLEVLIPPSFDTISKDKISVLEGGSISLECKPHGVPDPVVSWIRDGNKILVDNPILALFNVNQSDAGTYSCEALNEAGAAQVDFILDVLEPPWFDMSAGRFELTVLEGEEVILNCPYRGKPEPRTSWYKEGRRVHPGPSVKISNDSLTIAFARSHDSGTYVCAAISEAGTAEVNLTLTVYVPPKIHQIESSPIKAIDGHPVRLSCEASGVPAPSIKWLRSNGSSAAETSSGRATTEGGFFLDFSDGVQMEDKGRYICMAENEAGVEQEEVFLDVIAPPSINQSDWSGVDILAVSGQNTSLRCPAIGSPPPEIEWLRDGRSVQRADVAAAGEEEAFRPASRLQVDGAHGEVLKILNVQVEDAGEYLCLARNEGGTVDMKYKLEIVVPPYFPEDHPEFPASTQVVLSNHPFSLSCDVLGVPFPTFTWNKEGVPLPRDTLTRVRANRLHVSSAKEHHSGLYHCEASNVAGSAQQSYNVTILEPPRIFGSQLPMLITSVVGEPTVFECPARGFPLPSISWAKESVALDGSPKNGTLLIEETQTSDAGTYACTATNSAGIASQEFVLTVHVPPKIRDLPGTMDVVSGKPLVLECVSDGFPRPNLTWHGPVIAEAVHEHGLLRIAHIGKEHAGNYTCTAASEAGTDFKTTVLNVLTAPTIRKSSEDVVVVAGQPAILWCNTSGDPAPQVTWHKDNRHLQDDSDAFEILPNAVYIYTANVSDSGQYVCTVQNHVGSSQAVRNLDVLDPPAITVFYPEERTVVQGSEVSLVCQARGHPKPTVYWEHNGNLISNQEASLNQRYIFVTGGELKIPVAEVKEAGEYRCTAKNQAGWDTRTTTVTVHVPPTILKEGQEEELTLQRGGQAVLRCKADGFPLPTIRWTREGDPISNPRARTEASGDLIIDSAELDDSGSYVCVATNAAGVHHRVVSLAVLVPPSISRLPRDQEVAIGQPLELSCQAHGSPAPTITWTVNDTAVTGRKEETSEGVSVLALDSVSQLDQGTYVCVAANDVGQHKASADVKVRVPPRILEAPTAQETHEGRRAMLHCVAQGDPPPKVFWLKDGHQVPTVNSHVQQFPNGTIIISPTKPNDTGEYRCLATNKFGVSEAGAAVTILTPPSFTIKPQDTLVEKGSSLALDCSAQGIPPPEQSWSKLGHVTILASNRVALLTNGTLRIHMVNEADEGLYQCKSRSKAGVATANVQVKVKVAGGWSSWSPWGNCSSHCGGYRSRSRRCDNPAPRNDGLQCLGEASEVAPCLDCPESVNGGWSPWSLWSQCTASCGGGTRTRSRLCNSPTPAFGGKPCQGNDIQTDFCNSSACPVHGGWSDWSTWGECSATCGRRHRRRFRTCSNPEPSHGGRTCIGTDQDVKRCAPKPCPDLSNDEDMLGGQKALLELRARSIDFADSVACSKGYVMRHGTCEDLNECLDDDRCQHKCENLQGSYKCTCPPGYRIAIDAYSCQDIDECEEDDLNCGRNHICFNARGSYQCMYAPCPANYVRDTEGSSCRLSCGEDAACEPKAHFADVLTFKTVALPSGVTAGRDVVRLSARDHDSALLAHTLFTVLSNKRNVPFDVRVSKGVGIVFATEDLPAGSQYRVTLHATTRDDANKTALFETRFFLFVSTSLYPY